MRGRTKGRAPRRRRARDARLDAPRRVSARGEGLERPVAFGDARTERGGSRGRARVPAAVAASRMGFVPWLFVYANPKAKPPPRHALASALWLRTRMFPTVIVEGGGVVPAVRTAAGRSSSVRGARARRGTRRRSGERAKEKGARTLLGQGRAGFRNDPGAGSVVRKRTGDGAPRPRDPRAFGKRRRAPEEAERACSAAAFEAAARRASVGVAAERDATGGSDGRSRMRGVSRHARRSFVPGRICDRGLEISRTTGRAVLIGGGWGRGANAFHRTPIKTTRADRSNRTNHQNFLVIVIRRVPAKVWDTRHHRERSSKLRGFAV